jgi:hypothetical protein
MIPDIFILPILLSIAQNILAKILGSPFWGDGWGAARLAPTFALLHGYPIFAPEDRGAVLNTVYAPFTYLVYLPAGWFADISQAIMAGTAIAVLFFLLPVFLLLFQRNSLLLSLLLFAAFCLFALSSPPLAFSGFSIHADAPALGFGAIAIWAIHLKEKQDTWQYLISSIFVVAAVWTKQTMLPILVAIPFYLWISQPKELIAYLKWLGISLVAISLAFLLAFNPSDMFFNVITIPAAHPWRSPERVQVLLSSLGELIQACAVPLVVFLLCTAINWNAIRHYQLKDKPWILSFVIAIFLIPTTLLGRVKMGGVENTLSPTIYFLAIAALLVTQETIQNSGKKWGTWLLLGIVSGVTLIQTQPLNVLPDLVQSLPQNPQAVAFNYIKSHPSEVYFPFNPLSHLLAENKLYHFHYGLSDRQLAGKKISNAHFHAHIPINLKYVAFPPKFPSKDLRKSPPMQYLREFSEKISLPELSEWTVFSKPSEIN